MMRTNGRVNAGVKVEVRAFNPNGDPKFIWPAVVVTAAASQWQVQAAWEREEVDVDLFQFRPGDHCLETYFPSRWYNVIQVSREGETVGWYVNLATPASWNQGGIEYTDLLLDFVLNPAGDIQLRDLDQFETWLQGDEADDQMVRRALRQMESLKAMLPSDRPRSVFKQLLDLKKIAP